jgi:hypothetical protein
MFQQVTLLRTDLSIALTDNKFSTPDFVHCLNNHEFFVITAKIGCDNRFVSQGRTVFGWLEHKPNLPIAQQILLFGAKIAVF